MSDPYSGLGVPEDPYNGLGAAPAAPAGPPRKSQALGVAQGYLRAAGNLRRGLDASGFTAATDKINQMLPPVLRSATGGGSGIDDFHKYVGEQAAKGVEPGAIGDFAGSMVASAPLALLPGGPAVQGAAFSVANTTKRDPMGIAMDAGIGALGGKFGEGVAGFVGDRLTAAARPAIKALREAGVPLTPGQIFGRVAAEDKRMSRPFVGDKIAADRRAGVEGFNRAMVDRALEPLGIKLPDHVATGHDAIEFLQKTSSEAYERAVPHLKAHVDDNLKDGLQAVAGEVQNLSADLQKQFSAAIGELKFDADGFISGKTLQTARSEISRLAQDYSTSAGAADKQLGHVLAGLKDHLDAAIVRQNPIHGPAFQAAQKAFARRALVEDAAGRADEGVFSTVQARTASRRADPTSRKTATARGEGPMQDLIKAARQVLPSVVPDSGSAGRYLDSKLIPRISGAMSRVGYGAQGVAADLAARLPPEAAAVVRSLQRPVGLFGAAAPAAASARERRK